MLATIPENSELKDTFVYEVDDYNTICQTGANQNAGYRVNEISCQPANISFASMFSDDKTLDVFTRVLSHVRESQDVVSFPYRCDTETMCFYYRLTVSISAARHVLFFNKLLGVDPRQDGVRWEREKATTEDAIMLCSVCNKFLQDGRWLEFQEMIHAKLWPASGRVMPCSYTVCTACECGITHRIAESLEFANVREEAADRFA